MMYIPFEQVNIQLFQDLVERGYKDYVLQRFQWPSIENGKGFLLSAYTDESIAHEHAFHLGEKEGKAVILGKEDLALPLLQLWHIKHQRNLSL